jgi:hypothetical protein
MSRKGDVREPHAAREKRCGYPCCRRLATPALHMSMHTCLWKSITGHGRRSWTCQLSRILSPAAYISEVVAMLSVPTQRRIWPPNVGFAYESTLQQGRKIFVVKKTEWTMEISLHNTICRRILLPTLPSIFTLIDWLTEWLSWGETMSQNCGHQWAYCSFPGWYVSTENSGDDDAEWGQLLIRSPELSGIPSSTDIWSK